MLKITNPRHDAQTADAKYAMRAVHWSAAWGIDARLAAGGACILGQLEPSCCSGGQIPGRAAAEACLLAACKPQCHSEAERYVRHQCMRLIGFLMFSDQHDKSQHPSKCISQTTKYYSPQG